MTESVRGRVVVLAAGRPVLRNAVVELDGDRVSCVRREAAGDSGPVFDVLLPGLIDAHSHARGVRLSEHGVGRGPLERFLVELPALTALSPEDEALVAADASLSAGITAIQVMHHSFATAEEYTQRVRAIAAGCAAAGVRAAIALGLTDQREYAPSGRGASSIGQAARGIAPGAFVELAGRLISERGLVRIDAVGPVAPQWCSDRALLAIREVAGATRVHAHLLESARQRLAPDGDAVTRMSNAGLLSGSSSFAHGVWAGEAQIRTLAEAGATVIHCPGSNARLGTGTCPVRRLLDAGIPVALGLDSHGAAEHPDLFAEMREALERAADAGAPVSAAEVLEMATEGGARALCRPDLGRLSAGAAADLVAIDLPGAPHARDPLRHLVTHASADCVAGTWVAGRRWRPRPEAAQARARLAAAMAGDAQARTGRIEIARDRWQAVNAAWREAEARQIRQLGRLRSGDPS